MVRDERRVTAACFAGWCLRLLAATLVPLFAGCIDFVEPDLPDRGAPAVLEATLRLFDRSRLQVDARLAPGFDEFGLLREVSRPELRVSGRDVAPDSVLRNGTHVYRAGLDGDTVVFAPVEFDAPAVQGVPALPSVRWFPALRVGPDTLNHQAGEDLVLTISLAPGQPEPAPAIRQWTLVLDGGADRFTIAGTGVPPDSIVIPARWVPDSPNGEIEARLVYQQTADLRTLPGNYIGLVTLDTRISWAVRLIRSGLEPEAA